MIITLTAIALLIQFTGVYALLVRVQRAQDRPGEKAKQTNQRGRQAYYDAFGSRPPSQRA